MAKRRAEKYLTMENYDDEDNADEVDDGVQQVAEVRAADHVLKSRVMARAKRSDLNVNDSETNKRSAFSGFKGFDTKNSSKSGFANQFESFLSGKETTSALERTRDRQLPTTTITAASVTPNTTGETSTAINGSANDDNADMTLSDELEDEYNGKLCELNKSFVAHINSYMEKSRYYDFSLVCHEYINYHQLIDSERAKKETALSQASGLSANSAANTQNSSTLDLSSQQSFASTTTSSQISSQASATKDDTKFVVPSNLFSINKDVSKTDSLSNSSNFFNSFTNNESNNQTKDVNEDENDVPPKVEDVVHTEVDALFTKKCKLYFTKDNEFKEKGIGTLFIKKSDTSDKHQLLIRANNKLGNVLLNISLVESLPIVKADKNKGILLTCIPNPPLDTKVQSNEQTTVTFLIRVKISDIEDLYNNLNQYKSK